jgi:hypothetical protein
VLEAAHNRQLPQVVEVASPIKGARCEILHILMNEDARNLVIVVTEMLLFVKNA